jgi:hypothetical protein
MMKYVCDKRSKHEMEKIEDNSVHLTKKMIELDLLRDELLENGEFWLKILDFDLLTNSQNSKIQHFSVSET